MRIAVRLGAATAIAASILYGFSASAQDAQKRPLTAAEVRPPAADLVDCAKAPKDAVTKLPADLAQWATIYCTKFGAIFNANDKFYGAFPDSGLRASFGAASIDGKPDEPTDESYFTGIDYNRLAAADAQTLIALDPSVRKVLENKTLYRLDLKTKGGHSLSFIVIDPSPSMFWVFPLTAKGIDAPAFYVTSLETLNRTR